MIKNLINEEKNKMGTESKKIIKEQKKGLRQTITHK